MNRQQLKDVQSVIEAALNKYGDIVLSKNEGNNVFVMSIEEYRKKYQMKKQTEKLWNLKKIITMAE